MTQGLMGTPRMPASTASAVGVSGTMRVPVLAVAQAKLAGGAVHIVPAEREGSRSSGSL